MKKFIYLMLMSSSLVFAESEISAYRDPDKDYTLYEKSALRTLAKEKNLKISPLGSARAYRLQSPLSATEWRGVDDMQSRFESARDMRFIKTSRDPEFLRRISWLYPTDGCYVRAALFSRNFYRLFVPVPDKVFAFGNLRVKTPNHIRGVVTWWFHVASIVEVQGQKYVMDPAIEPANPLTLEEWLGRMGDPQKIKISICNSGATAPTSDCSRETDGMELSAEYQQKYFLDLEWNLLKKLGRDPEMELGDHPPWQMTQ